MTTESFFLILNIGILFFGHQCGFAQAENEGVPVWEPQQSGVNVSLRGLSVVTANVAWASGQNGTILRTIDGGEKWEQLPKIKLHNGATIDVDFRDVEAFDENTAIVMGVGSPAYIFKTTDGGENWNLAYNLSDPRAFLDAMDFWNEEEGIAFGDAIDGKLLIVRTFDGGDSWEELEEDQRPEVFEGQGGFAASGTCLVTKGESSVFIGLGGEASTVVFSDDGGETWDNMTAPIQSGDASEGINTIVFKNKFEGVMSGGNYNGDEATIKGKNLATTNDGGKTWVSVAPEKSPGGYRSCVAYYGDLLLAVGVGSCDFSRAGGEFEKMEGQFHTVMVNKKGDETAAFASGPGGKIARLAFQKNNIASRQTGTAVGAGLVATTILLTMF